MPPEPATHQPVDACMDEIRHLLNHYPPDCRPTHSEPLGNAGGMSGAQFWRIGAPRGTLILRRWPPEHPTADRLRLIHAVLNHAAKVVDFLPIPVGTRDNFSFVEFAGHLWELTPWMPGTANYKPAPSDEKLRAAMTALAQFHKSAAGFQPPPDLAAAPGVVGPAAIIRRLTRLRELTPGRINELFRAINDTSLPELTPLAREFLGELPIAIPRAIAHLAPLANVALPLQPCIRDIWHDHVLFTGDQVTGMIDFGAVDIDTPATDIARLLGSLAGNDRTAWQTGLAAYSTARALSRDETLAVLALDVANPVLAGCNWVHWIYVERREFERQQQVIDRFRDILARLMIGK